jgi:hypothetical protein
LFAGAPRAWSHAADEMVLPPGSVVIAPRTEARTGQLEMVAIFDKQIFAVFLSRFADGTPVTGAKIEASTDLQSAKLTETDPGIYGTKELLMSPGKNEVTIKFSAGGASGSQALTLALPTDESVAVAAPVKFNGPLAVGGAIVGAYVVLSGAFLLMRRRSPRRMLARAWKT